MCIMQGSGTPNTVGPPLVFLAGQKKPPCPKGYHPSATCCKASGAVFAVWHLFVHLATLLHSNHPDPSLACHQLGAGYAGTAVGVVLVWGQTGWPLTPYPLLRQGPAQLARLDAVVMGLGAAQGAGGSLPPRYGCLYTLCWS